MADSTRSDTDAARIKRGTVSVKTKRKQPFILESFLSHADGGRTKAKYRKNEIICRQGDPADAVFYIIDGRVQGRRGFRESHELLPPAFAHSIPQPRSNGVATRATIAILFCKGKHATRVRQGLGRRSTQRVPKSTDRLAA
jgi:hypothetical protein